MRVNATASAVVGEVFQAHERFLWGLCYRMTGCAADADDLVQETFARALAHPPGHTDAPWRPWLVRVALNLGRDLLRRRKRRGYVGPWLPAPIETGDQESPPSYEAGLTDASRQAITTEGRYDLLESLSYAFLLALEALTPRQRAVLLLRDVFDYSVRDTAEALDMSTPSVKTTHHRARRAMDTYDRTRTIPTRSLQERTRAVLERFLAGLVNHDRDAVEALLVEDVRTVNDGAGEVHAARKPVVGRARVARFYTNIATRSPGEVAVDIRLLNGLPALVIARGGGQAGTAARFIVRCDLAADGRIRQLHAVLATRKLTAVRFPTLAAS